MAKSSRANPFFNALKGRRHVYDADEVIKLFNLVRALLRNSAEGRGSPFPGQTHATQSLGHSDVLTTFTSYGQLPTHRQSELIRSIQDRPAGGPVDPAAALEALAAQMAGMVGGVDPTPFPRDEWLIGEATGGDGKTRAYVYHMQAPRFIARVVALDDEGEPEERERPFDVVSGVVYVSDGFCLCEIDWIDRPSPGEITGMLEAACDAVEAE